MKKIGILTTYFASNYGAALQPFALMRTLENMGYDVEMIPYKQDYIVDCYDPFGRKRFLRKNVIKAFRSLLELRYLGPREEKFQKYISRYITNGKRKLTHNIPKDKDFYFVGSDQLWRTFGVDENFDPVYCGFFDTKPEAVKIAYAVSGEHLELNEANVKYLKSAFDNFQFLSVREEARAKDFREFYSNKPIEVVADPTILADPSVFNEIEAVNPLPDTDYVLFYSIRDNTPIFIDKITEYAEKRNLKVLVLSEGYKWEYQRLAKKDKSVVYLPTAGEEEFLGAMKNAKAVFTPSFHGNVFAILNHQNVFTLTLDDGHDTRALNLLSKLGIPDRHYSIDDEFVDTPIDYDLVESNLSKIRAEATDYVQRALKLKI